MYHHVYRKVEKPLYFISSELKRRMKAEKKASEKEAKQKDQNEKTQNPEAEVLDEESLDPNVSSWSENSNIII